VIVPPPVRDSVTVQLVDVPALKPTGAHTSEFTVTAVVRKTEAVCDAPFREAVTVAFWSIGMLPAVALNVAVADPVATGTDAGMVNIAALLESVTVPPAVLDNLTVQVLDPPDPNVAGAHVSDVTVTGVVNAMEAV